MQLSELAEQNAFEMDAAIWKGVVTKHGDLVMEGLASREGECSRMGRHAIHPDTKSELPAVPLDESTQRLHFYQHWDGQLALLNPIYLRALLHNVDNDYHRLPPVAPDVRMLTSHTVVLDRNKASR